ncbi:MAG: transcription termination/antitermination protein NusG [Pyrinomonadaceae bacterium]
MEVRCFDRGAPQWFAVQMWSGREHRCAKHLLLKGYEVFLPCLRERRRWSDRIKVVDRPLFAGYVFCRADKNFGGKIVTVPGVIRIVSDDRGPSPIPAHEIDAIRRIVEARVAAEPWPVSLVGQKVRIELGPLRGITGTVLVVKNRRRLVVSVGLLPQAVAVEIDSEWVTTPLASGEGERQDGQAKGAHALPAARPGVTHSGRQS